MQARTNSLPIPRRGGGAAICENFPQQTHVSRRLKSAFSGAISRCRKSRIARPLVWIACSRLAGAASSPRRRVRWRRRPATKLTLTSKSHRGSPREYPFHLWFIAKIDLSIPQEAEIYFWRKSYPLPNCRNNRGRSSQRGLFFSSTFVAFFSFFFFIRGHPCTFPNIFTHSVRSISIDRSPCKSFVL